MDTGQFCFESSEQIFCGGPCLFGMGLFALVSLFCFLINAESDGARAASDSHCIEE